MRGRWRWGKDTSHKDIVEALRAAGAMVTVIDKGTWSVLSEDAKRAVDGGASGVPDLLVFFKGRVHLLECKTEDVATERKDGRGKVRARKSGGGKRNAMQEAYTAAALRHGVRVHVVLNGSDALLAIGAMPRPKAAPAYTPPRTAREKCLVLGCSEQVYAEGASYCAAHEADGGY